MSNTAIQNSVIMKIALCFFLIIFTLRSSAQQLQIHYDARRLFDPRENQQNFVTLNFEYLKHLDTGRFIKPGAFLLKLQADLQGDQSNIGKYYMQISQELRFWEPKIFLNLQYSGGLGVTSPRQYSYYIANNYSAGVSYPFKFGGAYFSTILYYKYAQYAKPSNDFLYTMYFYKGAFNYKLEIAGDFSIWTENKNHGDAFTANEKGKRFFFFAEPQLWFKILGSLYAGTKINTFYHVNTAENKLQIYPTAAIKIKL